MADSNNIVSNTSSGSRGGDVIGEEAGDAPGVPSQPRLMSAATVGRLVLRNRCVLAPMQMYMSHEGLANEWHLDHYAKHASGGFGLVFTEALAVQAHARSTVGDLGAWSRDHIEGLTAIAESMHRHGAAAGAQLWHSGPKAGRSFAWQGSRRFMANDGTVDNFLLQPLGPSDAPPAARDGRPTHGLTEAEIEDVVQSFGEAASRCDAAGFDAIEIHAAHGYLMHAFLSTVRNQRIDRYGGSLAGRMRLLLETVTEVRRRWPVGKPLFVRLSCMDHGDAAWTLEDTIVVCDELKLLGVDVIDCSSGGVTGYLVPKGEIPGQGHQVPYAEEIRRRSGLRTMAVGLITSPEYAEQILEQGKCDLVAVGRAALDDPYWPLHAAVALLGDPEGYANWPPMSAASLSRRYRYDNVRSA